MILDILLGEPDGLRLAGYGDQCLQEDAGGGGSTRVSQTHEHSSSKLTSLQSGPTEYSTVSVWTRRELDDRQ